MTPFDFHIDHHGFVFVFGLLLGAFTGHSWPHGKTRLRPPPLPAPTTSKFDSVPAPFADTMPCAISVPVARKLVERSAGSGEWRPAVEHAAALLAWLQAPGGFVGEIVASDIEEIYAEFCAEARWHVRPWAPVATELRRILGGAKYYGYRNGKRVRIWKIPSPASPRVAACADNAARPRLSRAA